MKYSFVSDVGDEFKGTLYELDGLSRKKLRRINVEKLKSPEIKIAIICQRVAEGGNLDELLGQSWSFGTSEFFHILKNTPEWEQWFAAAQAIRNKMVVEETFKKLKESDLSSSEAEGFAKILKTIQESIKKNEDSSGLKSIMNVYVHQPKAVVKRGWGVK